MPPPFIPPNDINAHSQESIGSFGDNPKAMLNAKEKNMLKESWSYVSQKAFQNEILELLQYEELHGPVELEQDSALCCVLL